MATNTYVALDKITVSGSSTTSVTFTSIPQGYTDLILVGNFGTTAANNSLRIQVGNGSIDTGANYSYTFMYGNGSSALSSRGTNDTAIYSGYTVTASIENVWNIHFQNYSNTTTKKTILERYSQAPGAATAVAGLWSSTSAINQIRALSLGDPFLAGSTFSLYGIAAEAISPAPKATGGAIYSDSLYYYHVFGSTGTFTPLSSLSCDYLVVAGGAGGGQTNFGGYGVGAGGGAGGVKAASSQTLSASAYTVTVGGGGTGGGSSAGGSGSSSSISGSGITTLTATGGATPSAGSYNGGASGADPSSAAGSGGTTSSSSTETYAGGGGGGSNAVGGSWNSSTIAGSGGNGTSTYSTWVLATGTGQVVSGVGYIAGGGGGGYGRRTTSAATGTAGTGGYGGGGAGTNADNSTGGLGQTNTGSGGGGAGTLNASTPTSGSGGSGVVIVRYAK